jgi:hypothetical protein
MTCGNAVKAGFGSGGVDYVTVGAAGAAGKTQDATGIPPPVKIFGVLARNNG